ncbi:hypothetical protein MTR67_023463, partial [Solanum verrucosum]
VEITYAQFVKKFQIFMLEGFNYDITTGRPKQTKWIEEMNKLDGYKQTIVLEQEKLIDYYKNRFLPVLTLKSIDTFLFFFFLV